jgi:hypothetical protein
MTTPATPPPVSLCFVLINRETARPDVDQFLPGLRDALDESLNQHFAPFHGGKYGVRVAASPTDRQPGEVAVNIRAAVATDPQGALGWHQVTNGVPDIELPLDTMTGLTGDDNSLDVVADHECKEAAGDPGANQLADNGNGKVSAKETCDRVEDQIYKASNGLNLSDFLLPSAWIPGAPGPYSYLQSLTSQLDPQNQVTMTAGGYDIEGDVPALSDVTPSDRVVSGANLIVHAGDRKRIVRMVSCKPLDELRKKRMAHPCSRAYRHGVRL